MHIAILGATSQIAKDLVQSFSASQQHQLTLFARSPQTVSHWLAQCGLVGRHDVADFDGFATKHAQFDAVINFVGVGNPAQALAMGASIFDVTLQYDQLALDYVKLHPHCKYIFLSSGAAYGSSFEEPVDQYTQANIAINHLQPQDWYAVSKLHAECRHRALAHLPIVDIRVFSYVSATQDVSAAFLTCDILRAIQSNTTLSTSASNIVRDYIAPDGFQQLVELILAAPATNCVVDCYTQAPVEKMTLLDAAKARYGLAYRVADTPVGLTATGQKEKYYSLNHSAEMFGYVATTSSLDNVLHAFDICLGK